MSTTTCNPDCQICCEQFNKSSRSKTECNKCNLESCKKCIRKYLMEQLTDAHCMGCKQGWSREEIMKSIGKCYYNKEYKNHRKDFMYETEKSRFPETMPFVQIRMGQKIIQEDIHKIERERETLIEKIRELEFKKKKKQGELATSYQNGNETKERKVFIKKCPVDECKGFLSSSWKCGICSTWVCPDCFEIKGTVCDEITKHQLDEQHTCDQNSLESAKLIKAETKGCPCCGVPIFKISGCDQMWCICCKIAFSWKTGLRVNGVIHNPHFYEFQRQGGGAVINAPNAQICGGIPGQRSWNDRIKAIFGENTHMGTYTRIRGFGENRREICGELEQHKKKTFECLLNIYQFSDKFKSRNYRWWETRDSKDSYTDILDNYKNGTPSKQINLSSFFILMTNFHRGANHFMDTELGELRRVLNINRDNQDLRVKFLMEEIDEDDFKMTLMRRDKQNDKKRHILDVFELMGAVYTEVSIAIYNIMSTFAREIGPRPRYPYAERNETSQRRSNDNYKNYFTTFMTDQTRMDGLFKMFSDISNEFDKFERVRTYCNKQLCKIGKSYNNGVTVIDSTFDTPKINIGEINIDMKKHENIQGKFYPLMKNNQLVLKDNGYRLKYI